MGNLNFVIMAGKWPHLEISSKADSREEAFELAEALGILQPLADIGVWDTHEGIFITNHTRNGRVWFSHN